MYKNLFEGIRVLDLTRVFSGPFGTRMLADYGAEVIKIESFNHPDDSRNFPPLKNGWSGYYELLNRNKKGISLNLSDKKELDKFLLLCKSADVIVENFSPAVKKKLKIDYSSVAKINPKIIYASLSGLGQKSNRKYYDIIAQAESGLISLTGTQELPLKIGPSVVDAFCGMTLAFAISTALFDKERTGEGQYIDVAMLGCAMNLLESNLVDYSINKKISKRTGNLDNLISPFGVYKVKDGSVVIAAGNELLWKRLGKFLADKLKVNNLDKFGSNELRLKHNNELTSLIEKVFENITSQAGVEILINMGIPCAKINNMADVFENLDNYKNKFLYKYRHPKLGISAFAGTGIKFSRRTVERYKIAPSIGQDNKTYGV